MKVWVWKYGYESMDMKVWICKYGYESMDMEVRLEARLMLTARWHTKLY